MKPRSYHCELSAIAVTAAPTQPPVQDSALKAWHGVAVNQVAGQQALLKRVPQ